VQAKGTTQKKPHGNATKPATEAAVLADEGRHLWEVLDDFAAGLASTVLEQETTEKEVEVAIWAALRKKTGWQRKKGLAR
jgi:hypothetical protein